MVHPIRHPQSTDLFLGFKLTLDVTSLKRTKISNMKIKMKSFHIVILLLIPLTNCNSDFDEQNEISSYNHRFSRGSGEDKYIDGQDSSLNNANTENEFNDDIALNKRAASPSFYGVRGRRQDRPSGFLGVRGKKSNNYIENEYDAATYNDNDFYDEYLDEQQQKRKPQGFVGLRGKKAAEETPDFVIAKRVPVTSFFGIGSRGKKEPSFNDYYSSSKYFGVRKKPSNSNSYMKFVGVRGKKSVKREARQFRLDDNSHNHFSNGLRMLQRRGSAAPPDKSIGFVGMRG